MSDATEFCPIHPAKIIIFRLQKLAYLDVLCIFMQKSLMLMSRARFFVLLFLLLPGPFVAPKLFWFFCSRRAIGKVYFTGGVLDPIQGTSKYLVVRFPLGKDTIEFQSNVYFRWPEDTAVMVRYSRFDPYNARLDVPVCIWGDTLVFMLLPFGIWLVLFLTPNRFDPLIPWGASVQLRLRRPFIRAIPPVRVGHAARRLSLTLGMVVLLSLVTQAQKKDTATLKQATVTARPVFVQKADRLIVNVDAMIAQGGSNALELLGTLPGVVVSPNGTIQFNGRTGVLVLIDDKPTYLAAGDLANYLRSLPVSLLDKIELMSNPPAKYDAASGAGIILIRTKKLTEKGWNMQTSAAYIQAYYGRTNESLAGNYHRGKINVYGNFSYAHQDSHRQVDIDREYYNPDGTPQSFFTETSTYSPVRTNATGKTGLDYYLTPRSTLGVLWMGVYSTSNNHSPEITTIDDPAGRLDSFTTAANSGRDHSSNNHVNLNFNHSFRTPGATLTADADYILYAASSDQLFLNTTYDSAGGLQSVDDEQDHLPTAIHIYTAKTDYTLPLTPHLRLETGAKYSSVSSDNTANYYYLLGDTLTPDYDKTNHFLYNEQIDAAYLSMARDGRRLSLQGGLRLESTESKGHQLGNPEKADSSFARRYTDLFPTGYLSYALDTAGRNSLRLSYGRRINRPNYQDLNPFVFLINRFTYTAGNPYLKPQYSDNLELAWTFRRMLTTTVFYNYTRDVQQEIIQSAGSVFISETGNIGHRTNLGVSINVNARPMKAWTTNGFVQVIDNRYDGFIGDSVLRTAVVSWSVNWNNQVTLRRAWAADLGGTYTSATTDGQFVKAPLWMVYAGIQRKILHERGLLRLAARDIFHTYQPRGHLTNIPLATASFRNYVDTQVIGLVFNYSLSQGKTKHARKADAADEEQGRIKN
jgi:hypothetical protein